MDNEVIDISLDFDNLDDSSFNKTNTNTNANLLRSTNFGGGLELLMNDKLKEGNSKLTSDIDIDDLNNLENELNDLSNENDLGSGSGSGSGFSKSFNSTMFNNKLSSNDERHSVKFDENINIGVATSETINDNKTWDGYSKFNNIPVNPEKNISSQPQLSKEELLREKLKYLRKLESLEKKGVELTKKYTMDSPLLEMQGEYEMIMEEKSKQNSVKFQGNMMMAIINGIEFLNNRFDPFDIKLDGWGEQINENINDYDEIFSELYEKYKSKATMAPELKLLFQLGGSAMMVHMTNTMFKSAMPGMDDILRQNPDLMRSFQSAAVNSMAQTNPGFSGFMNGLMNPGNDLPSQNNQRGPPPPMATQGPNAVPPPINRGGNNIYSNRPDITMAKTSFVDDGINIRENSYNMNQQQSLPQPAERSKRPEMKGPSDISDILSGLKTKTINIQSPVPINNTNVSHNHNQGQSQTNDSSTISINDLKDLQNDSNIPKRSKRRTKSDKNTISLDL
jgi:hypothetical protein